MEYSIDLTSRLECDLEMLMIDGFYPLKGFMTRSDYESTVNNLRLSDGSVWPMPIVLPISAELKEKIYDEKYVVLRSSTNLPLAKLHFHTDKTESFYKPDLHLECINVYGTDDDNHPYVKIVNEYSSQFNNDVWYIGGYIEKINNVPHFDFAEDRLTPEQTKTFFKENGWDKIVAFQTRNPMHRSHFELTMNAVNQVNAKLLVQPVVGITQQCDIDYHTRVRCYKKIMQYYPQDLAKLCLLPLSMRMAGPREALWHALIRKNYGCTHFIIGRDHAGPSSKRKDGQSFYGPYDAHQLLKRYQDEIGIEIITSQMVVYVEDIKQHMPIDKVPSNMKILDISGTEQRRRLMEGLEIPSWFSYPEIVEELRKTMLPLNKRGFCIYLVGLSGSGKTTVANMVQSKLKSLISRPITILDGDIVRKNLSKGLGFSKEDRSTNVRRIGFVASEIVKHNGIVICANIAPYKADREYNRNIIEQQGGKGSYIEVYMNVPIEICENRDIKGYYKMARDGLIKEFTGVSDPFEEPINPDIVLDNYCDLEQSVNAIIEKLKVLRYLDDE